MISKSAAQALIGTDGWKQLEAYCGQQREVLFDRLLALAMASSDPACRAVAMQIDGIQSVIDEVTKSAEGEPDGSPD